MLKGARASNQRLTGERKEKAPMNGLLEYLKGGDDIDAALEDGVGLYLVGVQCFIALRIGGSVILLTEQANDARARFVEVITEIVFLCAGFDVNAGLETDADQGGRFVGAYFTM
jgi:hypothetical protein